MKSIKKNMIISLLSKVIAVVCGMFLQRYILLVYGSVYNGLTSSISQVMSYLVLLESGLGMASLQALYKPLAEKDWDKAGGIISATAVSYRRIAYMFSALLVGATLLIPAIVADETDTVVAGALTLISGGTYIASYIWGSKYLALLNADRKIYISYILDSATLIVSTIVRVLMLKNGVGIVYVQLFNLVTVMVRNILIVVYSRRKYPQINVKITPDFSAVKKRWNVLIHSLAGLVVNHTDVMILTIFDSLKTVSVYSVYNSIFGQISSVVQGVFLQSAQGNFGHIYFKDKKKYERIYAGYETLYIFLITVVASLCVTLALPFLKIYTRGVSDISYLNFALPIFFCAILIMNQIRIPALITINAAGYFKETQSGAIIEAVINLTVSLLLFWLTDLGIYGLLIGTICSYVFRTTDVYVRTYKHLIDRKITKLIRTIVTNSVAFSAIFVIFYIICPVTSKSYLDWFVSACIIGVITLIAFIGCNIIINRKEFINSINVLFRRGSEKA